MNTSRAAFLATFWFLSAVFAQSPSAKPAEPLTADLLVEMTTAGLPDDIIVAKIRLEPKATQLTTEDLVALKKAGVADGVIRAALLGPDPKPDVAAPGLTMSSTPDPNDPMTPHDPGIYMMFPARDG